MLLPHLLICCSGQHDFAIVTTQTATDVVPAQAEVELETGMFALGGMNILLPLTLAPCDGGSE